MPEPTIVFAPILDPEVRVIADELCPPQFTFRNVATSEIPAAIRDADFLCGFIGPIETPVFVEAAANRLKLVQLMSAGYDRFNLSALKHVHLLDHAVRNGGWRNSRRVYELYHSTVGIVGMGRIGQEVAKRLAGWEATIIYYDPFRLSVERERELGVTYVSLDALLRQADAVTVHVPLNAA